MRDKCTHTAIDCAGTLLDLSSPKVMGVLNVTPDSFSDGSRYYKSGSVSLDLALRHTEKMLSEGADIIDIGGESTRPGAQSVSEEEELRRVIPITDAISNRFDTIVSIDSSNPRVMRDAAAAGAGLINDVRALQSPGAVEAAVATGLPICLMHMQGGPQTMQDSPQYCNVLDEVAQFLTIRTRVCTDAGIKAENILIDPGFGFGKSLDHNLKLLAELPALVELGFPVLVGLSRKSMIGDITGRPVAERVFGSVSAAAIAVFNGASIVRCHDVAATKDALNVAWHVTQSKENS